MIYLAGPMGRTVGHDNAAAFAEASQLLRSVGHEVSNPAETKTPTDYEGVCLGVRCVTHQHIEGVALLDGWEKSEGAKAEAICAISLGKPARPWRDWLR